VTYAFSIVLFNLQGCMVDIEIMAQMLGGIVQKGI